MNQIPISDASTAAYNSLGRNVLLQTWMLALRTYLEQVGRNLSEMPPAGKVVIYYRPY